MSKEPTSLDELMEDVRLLVSAKGFSSEPDRVPDLICRVHSEVTEAFQAWKRGKPSEKIGEELMDAVIYILHLCSVLNLHPCELYRRKMHDNWLRPYRYNTERGG